MSRLRRFARPTAFLIVFAVSGCAAWQKVFPPTPQSPEQALAVLQAAVNAAQATNASLITQNAITPQQGADLRDQLIAATAIIANGRNAAAAGRSDDAQAQIAAAQALLLQVNAVLTAATNKGGH